MTRRPAVGAFRWRPVSVSSPLAQLALRLCLAIADITFFFLAPDHFPRRSWSKALRSLESGKRGVANGVGPRGWFRSGEFGERGWQTGPCLGSGLISSSGAICARRPAGAGEAVVDCTSENGGAPNTTIYVTTPNDHMIKGSERRGQQKAVSREVRT